MADSSVAITAGSGTAIDTRTEGTNGNHRQVVVIGDPATNAGVAPVDATNGLAVDIKGNGLTALQLIDDAIHTDDAAATLGTSKGVGIMGFAGTQSVDSGDMGFLAMTTAGKLLVDLGADNDVNWVSGAAWADDFTRELGVVKLADSGGSLIDPVGASTPYVNNDVDETQDQVGSGAKTVYWIHAVNMTAAPLYLHLYNAATGSVTVGTTTPTMTFVIPTQGDTNGAGFALSLGGFGVSFGTALTIAATTTLGGTTGPAANGCIVNLGYV